MTKIGSLFGALLGAGGATAYYNGATEPGTFLNYMLGSPQWGSPRPIPLQGGGGGAEFDQLAKMVERLAKEVRSQGGGVTVIHGSQGTSAIFTYGGVFVVTAMGWMYIRGWKLSDFLYVTRASLQKSMATVTNSVEGLTQRMNSVKSAIAKQIEVVKARQEDAMKAQEELRDQMEGVGLDVESTRTNVAEVHNDLTKLGGDVQALTQQQTFCTEGICHLVGVLGDLMQQSNVRSARLPDLNRYLHKAQSDNPGLKGLFLEPSSSGRSRGQLLPAASMPPELEAAEGKDGLYPLRNQQGNQNQLPRKNWGSSFGMAGGLSRQVSAALSQRP